MDVCVHVGMGIQNTPFGTRGPAGLQEQRALALGEGVGEGDCTPSRWCQSGFRARSVTGNLLGKLMHKKKTYLAHAVWGRNRQGESRTGVL